VKREGQAPISKCFTLRKDTEAFARTTEVAIERDEYEATPTATTVLSRRHWATQGA
jgi:hypothetical protein